MTGSNAKGWAVILGMFASIILIFVFLGLVFMVLWNIIVPSTFGGPTLDLGTSIAIVAMLNFVGALLGRGSQT